MDKLWSQVFSVVRVDQDDPVQAWKDHVAFLKNRLTLLNSKNFKSLHFQSQTCDFTIALPADHIWVGGSIPNAKGRDFVPNLPTEEVFTSNLKTGVNGWVKSTRPLSYHGNLITDFSIWFEDGKIVRYEAGSGEEALKSLIETDEGSQFIGEVALVPFDSPISNSNLIFYNTLYDENASCHLAIGNAYGMCLKNGDQMNEEELAAAGLNRSLSHSDFMIGSADLSVVGTTESDEEIPLFIDGNWA
jgi:aminopeptidase